MADTVQIPHVSQPVVQQAGTGTVAWLAFFRALQDAINTLVTDLDAAEADLTTLETTVAGIIAGTVTISSAGMVVYPFGGDGQQFVSNASDVWMTVPSPVMPRITWLDWAGRAARAHVRVRSHESGVQVQARVVAIDSAGAMTRVLGTGTLTSSTGIYTHGWSPDETISLSHGTGTEDLALQVRTNSVSNLITASGYLEVGGEPAASASTSPSASESASVSPSGSTSPSSSASASTSPSSSLSASVSPSSSQSSSVSPSSSQSASLSPSSSQSASVSPSSSQSASISPSSSQSASLSPSASISPSSSASGTTEDSPSISPSASQSASVSPSASASPSSSQSASISPSSSASASISPSSSVSPSSSQSVSVSPSSSISTSISPSSSMSASRSPSSSGSASISPSSSVSPSSSASASVSPSASPSPEAFDDDAFEFEAFA